MTASIDGLRWMMVAPGQPMVREHFKASPQSDEVVVEIAGCGVCHTDLGYFYDGVRTNQPLPLALGHEISGRVVATGDAATAWLGRAVIVPAVLPCGECEHCRRGHPNICRRQKMPGNDIQGGFASHIVVPARGLCPVDEQRLRQSGLALADVAVVADAVTTPYQAVVRAELKPGSLAIVVGAGGVGGYACQIAHAFGAKVVAIDIDPEKLATIVKHTGALALNAREHDLKSLRSKILEYCKSEGLPSTEWTIFECSGTAAGQATAFGLLTYGATLCVVGFTMAKLEVRLSNLMAYDARAIGTWGCPPDLYPQALALVLDGKINLAEFVEQRSLSEINAVFAEAHDHKLVRRAVLVPQA